MLISVITRTYQRPLLLRRAAQSIGKAMVPNLEWVVVDDDGEISAETKQIVQDMSQEFEVPTKLINGNRSGRSGAANLGLKAAKGRFVHLHDDDDTVARSFYEKTSTFLLREPRYKGVRVFTKNIRETVKSGKIHTKRPRKHYPERREVSLFAAAEVFAYPPIGTVLDRGLIIDLGGFNEQLKVAEDYELILRFLTLGDIGTIPESLAYFHTRADEGASSTLANSPISLNFAQEDALFRDHMLRNDLAENQLGLGWLLALGRMSRKNRTLKDYLQALRYRLGP